MALVFQHSVRSGLKPFRRKIACPVLVVWGRGYLSDKVDAPLETWRDWAGDAREVALDCGHFLAEEAPGPCAAALRDFFLET